MGIDANIPTRSGQLAGWNTYSPTEKLALKVVYSAIQDYVADRRWDGKRLVDGRDEEYFNSADFEYWCSYLDVAPKAIRERLGITGDEDPTGVIVNTRLEKLLREEGL